MLTVAVGAWAWRWTLGPYWQMRFGPGAARGTSWGLGLHADVRPMDGMTDYVAYNVVALVVVLLLFVAHRASRPRRAAPDA